MDRGPSSYLSNVDLYLDGRLITSVQGDGMSVSVKMECVTGMDKAGTHASTFNSTNAYVFYVYLRLILISIPQMHIKHIHTHSCCY